MAGCSRSGVDITPSPHELANDVVRIDVVVGPAVKDKRRDESDQEGYGDNHREAQPVARHRSWLPARVIPGDERESHCETGNDPAEAESGVEPVIVDHDDG